LPCFCRRQEVSHPARATALRHPCFIEPSVLRPRRIAESTNPTSGSRGEPIIKLLSPVPGPTVRLVGTAQRVGCRVQRTRFCSRAWSRCVRRQGRAAARSSAGRSGCLRRSQPAPKP
jgi:hypothetical protein